MKYSMNPRDVKKVLDAKFNGMPYDEAQFQYYHLNRNQFNLEMGEVTSLTQVGIGTYQDNLGHTWTEPDILLPALGIKGGPGIAKKFVNAYHMPHIRLKPFNWFEIAVPDGLTQGELWKFTPYSRKFLRDDTKTGVGGEFEMVIDRKGKRLTALSHEQYQETYNFGRTVLTDRHIELDIKPHNANPKYQFKKPMPNVRIFDWPELLYKKVKYFFSE